MNIPPTLLPILAGLAVFGMIAALAFMFMDTRSSTASSRLESVVGKRRKESAAELLLKQDLESKDKRNFLEAITPEVLTVGKLFEQADCNIKPSSLMGVALILMGVGATFSFMVLTARGSGAGIFIAPIVGLVFFSLPFLWLLNKRRVRLKNFAAQLPDALELVARALRAGHALAAGMHVVAEEMPSPISDEFGRVYDEQNLGIGLDEAMRNMCDRVPNLDLRFFVTAVVIQRQTGGDLAEILDKIGYVVRERYKILGQVKALTAEGRLSGVILIGLPFALLLLMLHMKPDYVSLLWTREMGIKMSVFAIVLMLFGTICIKKIVDIKV
jgi:tight adherence protein B